MHFPKIVEFEYIDQIPNFDSLIEENVVIGISYNSDLVEHC